MEDFDSNKSLDYIMLESMSKFERITPQKNLTKVEITNNSKKTKFTLVLLPEWSVDLPPYNLSRLSSITRKSGYSTTVFDFNVKSYHILKTKNLNLWEPYNEWKWTSQSFKKEILPHFKNLIEDFITKIVDSKPNVVGFSMYTTNEFLTNFVVLRLKKMLPNCKFIVGGPNVFSLNKVTRKIYDFVVEGEGELALLKILDSIENNEEIDKIFYKNTNIRIDLDSLPYPDYSDYDLSEYKIPNGVSAEISRGCIAKCVFCSETHFWKYRNRISEKLLNEVEHQYLTYGLKNFWFIDSLVNGNLRELKAFALGLVERNIKINWQGYARCDKRMDLEYFKILEKSGCKLLNFGVESGSQKVLNDMKKEITVEEVEQNFSNASICNIKILINLITGFPTENVNDFDLTFTLLWRIKNYNISHISQGVSFSLTADDIVSRNPEKYNIDKNNFQGMWTTNNLTNTKLHRLIRHKTLAIFLHNLNVKNKIWITYNGIIKKSYNINYDRKKIKDNLDRENFDYNIIETNLGNFANSAVNEIWVLLRKFWLVLGPYEIKIIFSPEMDNEDFGYRLGCNFTSNIDFKINDNGIWDADFYFNFVDDEKSDYWGNQSFIFQYKNSGKW